ncbi:hypothetical protein GCM10009127_18960 [Alteraurantiacibacter aestuarii]|uniref:hypothetical protein n=1 Tax=Alteraurantiacibacter aestuarii TaxID=650004 RepID=UPI0031D5D95F
MILRKLGAIAMAAAILAPMPAGAYKIGSTVPTQSFDDLHETMTRLALECFDAAEGGAIDCRALLGRIATDSQRRRGSPADGLSYATRWPDDPSRMLDNDRTLPKFGVLLARKCSPYTGEGQRINTAGLLCSSHFGRLSFLHAMRNPGEEQSFDEVRELMLAGALFAFDTATDKDFREGDFCDTVQKLGNAQLQDALTFSADTFCHRRRKHVLFVIPDGWYEAWKVQTFFALECGNSLRSLTCNELGGDVAQAAATGAILHMIQDSFSQAHVYRSDTDVDGQGALPVGPYIPRITCEIPRAVYDYEAQTAAGADIHDAADHDPMHIDASCTDQDRKVDDPLTASARVIAFIRSPQPDRAAFERYLRSQYFPQEG